jgi:hypothetical protein
MSSIFDMVQQQLGGAVGQQIGQRLGLDPAMTQTAINAAIPAILGGMAAHASNQNGANEIHAQATNPAPAQNDGGLLDKMVGHRSQAIHDGIAQATGIDSGKAAQITGMLAPIVMGALAKKNAGGALNPGSLGGILSSEQNQAHTQATQKSPGLGGMLGSVLSGIGAS